MAGSGYGTRTIFQGVRSKNMHGYTWALKYLSHKNEFNWDTFPSIHHSIPLPFISFSSVFSMNRLVPSSVRPSIRPSVSLSVDNTFLIFQFPAIQCWWNFRWMVLQLFKNPCIKRLIFECRFHTLNHNHSSEFLKDLLTPKVSNQTSKMYESLPFIQNVHSS